MFPCFQAGRFSVHLSHTPGPGTYSVSKKSDWLRKTYPPPSAREEVGNCFIHSYTCTCTWTINPGKGKATTQWKGKATQHNSPKTVIWLPRVGLEPTTWLQCMYIPQASLSSCSIRYTPQTTQAYPDKAITPLPVHVLFTVLPEPWSLQVRQTDLHT